ncbi:very-short-patch-repair endonuclease [Methylohalomonas lacus]|uniref:Very-short-patch-repair endonuclease n=1 Tax=Methylohalomonas lacus TaxID=398773 RepID=A0AAE3L5V0_9GAMM|nr:endonuclease domain-containing protein [Methylohalomonas lacus]MCS3904077.1 very-short-patch-repair endonuclease [Methylohalomonas lacus]
MDVQRARQLRSNPTDAERLLWRHLCRRQMHGVRFRRQQPIGPYIVDFISFEAGLIVEIDGGQHQEQVAYDDKRSRWLERQGYRVLRYWNNEVLSNVDAVLTDIGGYLSPPP